LVSRSVRAEMRFVVLRLERALVMIEPPGEARVRRVTEIENRVLFAREGLFPEQLPGPVGESPQPDPIHRQAGPPLLPLEAQEGRRGRDAVEAMVVVADLQDGPCHRATFRRWRPGASAPGSGAGAGHPAGAGRVRDGRRLLRRRASRTRRSLRRATPSRRRGRHRVRPGRACTRPRPTAPWWAGSPPGRGAERAGTRASLRPRRPPHTARRPWAYSASPRTARSRRRAAGCARSLG